MYVCVCVFLWLHVYRGQKSNLGAMHLIILRQGFSLAWNSLIGLGWLANEP